MALPEHNNKRFLNPEFKKIIKLAKDLADQNNIDFYFIYITEYKKYKKKFNNDQNFNDYKKVIDYVSSLDIPIIDLHKEVFEKHEDPLSLFPFRKRAAGYSPSVNKIITKLIFDKTR